MRGQLTDTLRLLAAAPQRDDCALNLTAEGKVVTTLLDEDMVATMKKTGWQ